MDVLVLGKGVSGMSAKRLLQHQGFVVEMLDDHDQEQSEKILYQKRHSFAILSPGIPLSHPWVQHLKKNGCYVIGELELGLKNLQNPAIGITGTNGKTTTTELISHVLNFHGLKALAVGNNGHPLCENLISLDAETILVIEMSSYQLETAASPKLDYAAILNVTPDHLERYESFHEYMLTKLHIQHLLKKRENLYLTPRCQKQIQQEGLQVPSHLEEPVESTNLEENYLAAKVLTQQFGIGESQFYNALETFSNPRHRLEFVKKIAGISFYNDSKGTNLDAVVYALEKIKDPIILLVGGQHKGYPYHVWKEALRSKVKKIFAFGEAKKRIESDLQPFEVQLTDSLKEAATLAFQCAMKGDSVVLSPGCASFDMYKDYRQRGQEFESIIKTLGKNP